MFSNETYDKLKWVAQYALPAFGTLCFAIISLWGLPYGTEIIGTITAIDAFIGGLLGISSSNYEGDGTLVVDTSNKAKDIYRLELNGFPEELVEKDTIILKVNKPAHLKE